MKQIIIDILTERAGEWVSGEELAELCGVSRQAINKHVKALRLQDVEIEGRTKEGYRLLGEATWTNDTGTATPTKRGRLIHHSSPQTSSGTSPSS